MGSECMSWGSLHIIGHGWIADRDDIEPRFLYPAASVRLGLPHPSCSGLEPRVAILSDELIVSEMRIVAYYPVDGFGLSG